MKKLLSIIIILAVISCDSKVEIKEPVFLSVSPSIDLTNQYNKDLILILEKFLKTKNISQSENEHWLKSDFKKYKYPYLDIFQIEKSQHGENHFKPSLMELISLGENEKVLKIAFIGIQPETKENFIKCIYTICAEKIAGDWKLKRALDYQTQDWQKLEKNSITYFLSPGKIADETGVQNQATDIQSLCEFFQTEPLKITYYSCINPKQVFEVKGFDYTPNMYFSETGGMADYGNIIYSGNNSEHYTHEIVHLYTKKLFPNISGLLDEGMATLIGGSGKNTYDWHRENIKNYMERTSIDLAKHFDPYERLYINDETPIPYMIGGLICERILRLFGKVALFKLFNSNDELWSSLNEYGLTKENLTEQLKAELLLPTLIYQLQP